jgi:hypothetical protein
MRTNRLRPTATGSTPVVGQEVFVKVHGTFHKAVVKKILPLTDPPMYMCVHSSTSRYSGQVQAALEADIIPACDTYKSFKRSRDGLKQFAQDLSQSSHAAAPQPASSERRQRKGSKLCAQRKTSVLCLPGKYTAAATTAHRRGERGSRSTLSKLRFMLPLKHV